MEASAEQTFQLAPFNPTCMHAQGVALGLLSLNEEDVLFDLGCGDGRFLIAAADRTSGLKCVGIEIDCVYIKRAEESLSAAPLEIANRVEIREGDVTKLIGRYTKHTDDSDANSRLDNNGELSLLHDATAVFLYLLPKGLKAIKLILEASAHRRREENRPFRVVSYMFHIPGWEPAVVDRTTKGDCAVYLYRLSGIKEIS